MSSTPKVTIIIPTYNRPQLIERTVKSALDQTYKNLEIIVVDGDKTGATSKALAPYVEKYPGVVIDFRFEQLPRTNTVRDRANIARNRNAGIKMSTGKYIAPLDDDDYWVDPKKIEKQVAFFESHLEYTHLAGGVIGRIIGEGGKVVEEKNLYPEHDEDIRKGALFAFGVAHSAVMYRRSDWEKIGGYDEIHPVSETWDFPLRLGKLGKFYNFQDYFVGYAIGEHEKDHIVAYGRYCIRDGFRIMWTYRKDYPGVFKAMLVQAMYLLYTFVPRWLRRMLRFIAVKVQIAIFRSAGGVNTVRREV